MQGRQETRREKRVNLRRQSRMRSFFPFNRNSLIPLTTFAYLNGLFRPQPVQVIICFSLWQMKVFHKQLNHLLVFEFEFCWWEFEEVVFDNNIRKHEWERCCEWLERHAVLQIHCECIVQTWSLYSHCWRVLLQLEQSLAVSILVMAFNILIDAIPLHNADTRATITRYFCARSNWRKVSDCLALHLRSPSILHWIERVSNGQTCILIAPKNAMSVV